MWARVERVKEVQVWRWAARKAAAAMRELAGEATAWAAMAEMGAVETVRVAAAMEV